MVNNAISELEMIYYDDNKILKNIPLKKIVVFVDFSPFSRISIDFLCISLQSSCGRWVGLQ